MRISIMLATMAGLVVSAPAIAADTSKDSGEKVVCKTERFVGSRISTRVCKTRAEWDEGRKRALEALDHERDKNAFEPNKTGG